MSPDPGPLRPSDRHGALLDELGAAICAGSLPVGTVLSAEELCARHGVSRSVVRETLRVLSSMGLVAAKRGVGTTTQPAASWNLHDPTVIAWRLRSPDRLVQLRELAELRVAFEPEAAALAASHRDPEAVSQLIALGGRLWSAARQGDTEGFLAVDAEFHAQVLAASGNPMFCQFAPIVTALLVGRAEHGLAAFHPTDLALERHMTVMRAIQTGEPDRARTESRALIMESLAESNRLWRPEADA